MLFLVSLLVFIGLTLWIGTIYFTDKKRFRIVKYNKGEYYLLSRNMYFVILTVCTGPLFVRSFPLLKYGLWFLLILFLMFARKVKLRMESIMISYMIFYLWLCVSMTYTTVPRDGFMLLIKYIIPILFCYLAYSSIRNEKDLVIFLKVVNVVACIYCFFIGGQGYKLMPGFYFGPIGQQFIRYAGFADYLTSIFIVPIILYWLTSEKKYIFCALWLVLSTILESVRTGLGGMMLVFVSALLLRYKARAIPGVLLAGALFISIILFVPSINQKFFGEEGDEVTVVDIVQGDALSQENMNTSGRTVLWEMVMEHCYKGHEMIGSGLGTSMRYLKNWAAWTGAAPILHNDYVQIISDSGIVGIVFIILFYIVFLWKGIVHVVLKRGSACVKLTGIMAVSSMAGIAFSMYYDNVVSHSMSSLVMPFIFLGFFLKFIDIDEYKQLSK